MVSSAAKRWAFSVGDAYAVLAAIGRRRGDDGWRRAGRKVGFTNRTIWDAYGVDRPFWADVWDRTALCASGGAASVALGSFAQPCVEPEVAFGLRGPVPVTDDPVAVLAVEWMAPAFEVVRCPYPGWRFGIADCIAAAGLHGTLVIGTRVRLDDANRDAAAAMLGSFEATLSRNGALVDSGVGANVLDSPRSRSVTSPAWSPSSRARPVSRPRARHRRHDHERPPPVRQANAGARSTARLASSRSP